MQYKNNQIAEETKTLSQLLRRGIHFRNSANRRSTVRDFCYINLLKKDTLYWDSAASTKRALRANLARATARRSAREEVLTV